MPVTYKSVWRACHISSEEECNNAMRQAIMAEEFTPVTLVTKEA